MAYASGQIVRASDFNALLATANAVYGQGYGNRGYGQTTYAPPVITTQTVAIADVVVPANWVRLRGILVKCLAHQGGLASSLGANPAVGEAVSAITGLSSLTTAIDTNRLSFASNALSYLPGIGVSDRTSSWAGSIDTSIKVYWPSEDQARFFFNSGGFVDVIPYQQTGNAIKDQAWRETFNIFKAVRFYGASNAPLLVAGTTPNSLGYYGLTDDYQTIYSIGRNGSEYNIMFTQVVIMARRIPIATPPTGTNGGNGVGVEFSVTLTETGGAGGTTSAGASVTISASKATTYLQSIVTPQITVTDPY